MAAGKEVAHSRARRLIPGVRRAGLLESSGGSQRSVWCCLFLVSFGFPVIPNYF